MYFSVGKLFYEGGPDTGKDFNKAARYFHGAFERGKMESCFYLAKLHWHGWGVEQNFETSFHYLTIGADYGDASAMCFLGNCYRVGLGTEQDMNAYYQYQ